MDLGKGEASSTKYKLFEFLKLFDALHVLTNSYPHLNLNIGTFRTYRTENPKVSHENYFACSNKIASQLACQNLIATNREF